MTGPFVNFSAIPRSSIGAALRLPLKLLPKSAVIPVIQGPLRGTKWIVGSGVHGYWLGSYEWEKVCRFLSVVQPGMVCYDLGANVGYYSLLFSKLVGATGRVVAFEPLPRNAQFLRRHIALNALRNITVRESAVADEDETAMFNVHESDSMGSISGAGKLAVRCERLDQLVRSGAIPPPDFLKLDIEGAEARALNGAQHILREIRPVIAVATHGPAVHKECCELLRVADYCLIPMSPDDPNGCQELIAEPAGFTSGGCPATRRGSSKNGPPTAG